MHFINEQIIAILLSLIFGGGAGISLVKIFLESEVRKTIMPLLDKKQDREVCIIQHHTLDARLDSIDKKLDILIEGVRL